jgi:hypothetical protein
MPSKTRCWEFLAQLADQNWQTRRRAIPARIGLLGERSFWQHRDQLRYTENRGLSRRRFGRIPSSERPGELLDLLEPEIAFWEKYKLCILCLSNINLERSIIPGKINMRIVIVCQI